MKRQLEPRNQLLQRVQRHTEFTTLFRTVDPNRPAEVTAIAASPVTQLVSQAAPSFVGGLPVVMGKWVQADAFSSRPTTDVSTQGEGLKNVEPTIASPSSQRAVSDAVATSLPVTSAIPVEKSPQEAEPPLLAHAAETQSQSVDPQSVQRAEETEVLQQSSIQQPHVQQASVQERPVRQPLNDQNNDDPTWTRLQAIARRHAEKQAAESDRESLESADSFGTAQTPAPIQSKLDARAARMSRLQGVPSPRPTIAAPSRQPEQPSQSNLVSQPATLATSSTEQQSAAIQRVSEQASQGTEERQIEELSAEVPTSAELPGELPNERPTTPITNPTGDQIDESAFTTDSPTQPIQRSAVSTRSAAGQETLSTDTIVRLPENSAESLASIKTSSIMPIAADSVSTLQESDSSLTSELPAVERISESSASTGDSNPIAPITTQGAISAAPPEQFTPPDIIPEPESTGGSGLTSESVRRDNSTQVIEPPRGPSLEQSPWLIQRVENGDGEVLKTPANTQSDISLPSSDALALPGIDVPQVQRALGDVPSAHPTGSSVEMIVPRRSREALISRMHQEQGIADAQPADEEVSAVESSVDNVGDQIAPTASVPEPPTSRIEPEMIQTDIGPLPSDLWEYLGHTPPAQPTASVTQGVDPETPQNLSSIQRAPLDPLPESEDEVAEMQAPMPPLASIQRQAVDNFAGHLPTLPLERDTDGATDIAQTSGKHPVPQNSAQLAPIVGSLAQSTGTDVGSHTTGTIQRQPENGVAEGGIPAQAPPAETSGDEENEDDEEPQPPEIDTDELARQVYAQLKRRLAVELERIGRR